MTRQTARIIPCIWAHPGQVPIPGECPFFQQTRGGLCIADFSRHITPFFLITTVVIRLGWVTVIGQKDTRAVLKLLAEPIPRQRSLAEMCEAAATFAEYPTGHSLISFCDNGFGQLQEGKAVGAHPRVCRCCDSALHQHASAPAEGRGALRAVHGALPRSKP